MFHQYTAGTFFMLYRFVKILMTVGLRFFYRHIYVTGLENIPAKGPAIIIANHASSLMDAALLGILFKRPAYFFARADVFINKPVQKILSWLHMMPVHHHEEGRHTIKANTDSFLQGQKILSRGGIVVFFPESSSHIERQLLSFRKGVFRLAFKTASENDFAFEIPVIPVGITYEHAVAGRTEVLVHAGAPLLLSEYKNLYKENPSATLLRISKDAYRLMIKQVLHIENENRLQTAEYFLIITRNNFIADQFLWKIQSMVRLKQQQSICEYINTLPEAVFKEKESESELYFDELEKYNLDDKTIAGLFLTKWEKIRLQVGYIFYLAGMFFNALPIYIARKLADKKVYRKDFYSWIFVACYSVLYFIWIGILLLISLFLGWQYVICLFFLIIPAGIFAFYYTGWLKTNDQQKKLRRLSQEVIAQLKNQRNVVVRNFQYNAKIF